MIPLFLIYYQEWITIIGLSLHLMNLANFREEVRFKMKFASTDSVHIVSEQDALFVDFIEKNGNKNIKSYVFLPWQNMEFKQTPNSNFNEMKINPLKFIGVNEFTVVYEHLNLGVELTAEQRKLAQRIEKKVFKLLEIEENNNELAARDGFTKLGKWQVIKQKQFDKYVVVDIAAPGSILLNNDKLIEEFPKKMILVHIIPDYGVTKTSWISPYNSAVSKCMLDNESEIRKILKTHVESAIEKFDQIDLLETYEETWAEMKKILKVYENCSAKDEDYFQALIHRFFLMDEEDNSMINPFPDYQPKTTPDEMIDYRPSLTGQVEKIPEADKKNLNALLQEFVKYKQLATENPGEWQEGNPLLGARLKEYSPSDEELLLNEIGNRLILVVQGMDKKTIQHAVEKTNFKEDAIEFKHFTFVHYDVMGSGRFFYVDTIEEINWVIQ